MRTLLERYYCPVPFHAVRTRFLGNIASPSMGASPIEMVKSLWGRELPVFESLDAANELIGTLVMGLWNRLTRHQERSARFRLMRLEVTATREGMGQFGLLRREELDGFVEGLFGMKESHRQSTALSPSTGLQTGGDGFGFFEDVSGGLQELKAGDGRTRATIGSLEQFRAEPKFEIAQPPAERRLTDAQRFGCLSKTTVLRSDDHPSQVPKFDCHRARPTG